MPRKCWQKNQGNTIMKPDTQKQEAFLNGFVKYTNEPGHLCSTIYHSLFCHRCGCKKGIDSSETARSLKDERDGKIVWKK